MITLAILNLLYYSIAWVFYLLPNVSLDSGVSVALHSAVSAYNGFMATFPFAQIVWTSFLWLLAFEGSILIARFFFGSRLPIVSNTMN